MIKIILLILIILFVIALVGVCFLELYPGVGNTPNKTRQKEYEERTEYFYNGQFHNENEVAVSSLGVDIKGTRLTPTDAIPVVKSENIEQGQIGKLYVTWLGHSSALVQLGEKNILIDPVFSRHSSPVQFAGPKRFSDVPIEPENLPEIDILMLSHDHYDHMDYKTIKKIDSKIKKYIVPLGVECYLIGWGIDENKISTVAWYDELEVEGISVVATPSQHFTGRNPLKSNSSWWCGFYFEDDYHNVYYSGDGGYYDIFKRINERFGDIDLALVECGQYGKGWPYIHMFPEQVAEAAKELNAKCYVPIHWGAYCICNNDWDDSIVRFSGLAEMMGINYATPKIGERVDYDAIDQYHEHWWEGLK